MMRARARMAAIPGLRQQMDGKGFPEFSGQGLGERLPLASLATRRAIVERTVQGREMPRLSRLCDPGDGVRARLSFSRGDEGFVLIDGVLTASLSVDCQRCLEAVTVELSTNFSVAAVMTEADAARLGAGGDVVELETEEPTVAELIEDELILALPQRPCAEPHCEKAPPLSWPPDQPGANKPFGSLAVLKKP